MKSIEVDEKMMCFSPTKETFLYFLLYNTLIERTVFCQVSSQTRWRPDTQVFDDLIRTNIRKIESL